MDRVFSKTGLKILVLLGVLFVSGCSWFKPKVQGPSAQVCPPLPTCAVCGPAACPAPRVIQKEKIVEVPVFLPPKTAGELGLLIIGEVERVVVDPPGILYDARIDTGAESSSVHAEDIHLIERDGEKYVLFKLFNTQSNEFVELKRRLQRKVLIKQKDGEPERRYVVKLWLTMGDIKERIDVTLTNRSDFAYPLLVGRNLLTDIAIVDVSRRHTITSTAVKSEE